MKNRLNVAVDVDPDLAIMVLAGVILILLLGGYFMIEDAKLRQQIVDINQTRTEGFTAFQACMQQFESLGLVQGVNCYTCTEAGCARMNVTVQEG